MLDFSESSAFLKFTTKAILKRSIYPFFALLSFESDFDYKTTLPSDFKILTQWYILTTMTNKDL